MDFLSSLGVWGGGWTGWFLPFIFALSVVVFFHELGHLGAHDMRIPIAHCLAYPDRIDGPAKRLDLAEIGSLTFEKPDLDRFPALGLAWHALRTGSGATTVLTRRTKSRSPSSLPARSGSPAFRRWWKQRWRRRSAAA